MQLWTLGRESGHNGNLRSEDSAHVNLKGTLSREPGEQRRYRLQHYEIRQLPDDRIFWRRPASSHMISEGPCSVLEGILIVEFGQKTVSGLTRRQFYRQLALLPKWDGTQYYCLKSSLFGGRPCTDGAEKKEKASQNVGKTHREQPWESGWQFDLWKEFSKGLFPWSGKGVVHTVLPMFKTLLAAFIRLLRDGKKRLTHWCEAKWKKFS